MALRRLAKVVIPEALYAELVDRLWADGISETGAVCIAGVNRGDSWFRVIVRETIVPQEAQMEGRSLGGVELSAGFVKPILERLRWNDGPVAALFCHTHPFADEHVGFSFLDMSTAGETLPYIKAKIPQAECGTVVFGRNSAAAHLWDGRSAVEAEVWVMGRGMRRLDNGERGVLADWVGRQVLGLGEDGQGTLEALTVGVAGCGGTGALVCEMLARAGVRDFILADGDVVERTNLNRLTNAYELDALLRRPKAEVARREILRVNPMAEVETCGDLAPGSAALDRLRRADALFGCVDNDAARLLLNDLAVRYCIPYLDIGVGLERDGGGLSEMGGQVRAVLPGGFCLECIDGLDREAAGAGLLDETQRTTRAERGYGLGGGPAPAVMFLNSILASAAVQEFVGLATGMFPVHPYLHYDGMRGKMEEIGAARRGSCVACAGRWGVGDLPARKPGLRLPRAGS